MNWVDSHGVMMVVLFYVFSAVTGGMPTPVDNSSLGYRWAFATFSILNASIARLIATQLPSSKMGQALQGTQPVQDVVTVKPASPEKASDGIKETKLKP